MPVERSSVDQRVGLGTNAGRTMSGFEGGVVTRVSGVGAFRTALLGGAAERERFILELGGFRWDIL